MTVQGERRDVAGAHEVGEIRPDGESAFGQDPVVLVEHLVEDRQTLVGLAHLVGVGVHEGPPHLGRLPRLDDAVLLPAHVLDGLADACQQLLERGQ